MGVFEDGICACDCWYPWRLEEVTGVTGSYVLPDVWPGNWNLVFKNSKGPSSLSCLPISEWYKLLSFETGHHTKENSFILSRKKICIRVHMVPSKVRCSLDWQDGNRVKEVQILLESWWKIHPYTWIFWTLPVGARRDGWWGEGFMYSTKGEKGNSILWNMFSKF